ncbi:peptidase M15 [Hyphomicrobium methylovorum]|uniref:YcbK family protein n=1 Tax=Hyphomicrobium methylovorum TaxID=84 RepID=UPI0015E70407|nr:D-Ala-D-Ala carboxypeptidase family metallohydrolase [Hyphomicrobium methylovorum]MBA2125647.1 peptidase M15 [Hyphomicrobium methylovorum]
MSKGFIAIITLMLITLAAGIANARSYDGDHSKMKSRAMTSSGSSVTCLSWDARALLNRIRSKFGNVQIVSTCRPGARIAGTRNVSRHSYGKAIDFRVPGRKAEVVRWLIANHRTGGVMTYRDMDHIHVDIGPHFVALNRPSGRT